MTKKKRYRRYSPEFKRSALRRASEEGMTDILICEELGISTRQLRRWRDEFRLLGDDAFSGQGLSRDEEITKLRRELTKVTQERDFLKEAAVHSIGRSNTLCSRQELWSETHDTNGQAWSNRQAKGGAMGAMENGRVAQRYWPGNRQARWLGFWGIALTWRYLSTTSTAI